MSKTKVAALLSAVLAAATACSKADGSVTVRQAPAPRRNTLPVGPAAPLPRR